MTFLLCPLCGKQTSLNNFDPTGFDLDVMTQEVVGLGKGKGFASTGRGSIMGNNSTCVMIKNRMLDLLEEFYEHDIVTEQEIANRFGLSTADHIEVEADETQALKEEREESYATIRQMIESIEEVTEDYGSNYFNDSDGLNAALTALGSAVQGLADAYTAVKEGAAESLVSIQDMITEIESNLGAEGEFTIDENGGLANAIDQLKNAVLRVVDELAAGREAGGENYESFG